MAASKAVPEGKDRAYCVKCQKKNVKMVDAKRKKMKNGRPMVQGTCGKCGTKLTRILSPND